MTSSPAHPFWVRIEDLVMKVAQARARATELGDCPARWAVLQLAAIERRRIDVVLLAPREKKPPLGRRWQITSERDVAERHLRSGGNLGLVAGERNGLAILDPDELLCWADMIDTLGQPCLPWVETGSGKLHYYIAWEPGLPAS
jgi:Bifunctional DNA primase/polymerase, N-terminal